MFYLGNFRLDKTIKSDVEEAAKIIKRDIRFLDDPMPHKNEKVKVEEKYVSGFGCIAVFDGKKDCSKFWTEFNRIRKISEAEKTS